eukprot:TRINITY_DN10876_c0_g1_i1.p1 TRINITY_DN10876_c0_g1~~TRINITY_DN10876_c0_g1_i1.p1  ORF type:complete len:629 (+),score=121.55 TRINITY_DN10876_c0_g1_i1:49-1935(+)
MLSLLATAAVAVGPATLVRYNLSYTNDLHRLDAFEQLHTVAALSGLVNRDSPQLFTPLLVHGGKVDGGSSADDDWRDYMSRAGGWWENTTFIDEPTLEGLASRFRAVFSGVVLYDPDVPATSNVASTAAGVENLLPVCYRPSVNTSVYSRLVAGGPRFPVTLNLVGMFTGTASPKVAAYQWARERWLAPGASPAANPAKIAYYVDYWAALHGDALGQTPGLAKPSNQDYFVSQRAFFFDLSVWADEPPVDDPTQPLGADKAEMVNIFYAAYLRTQAPGYTGEQMIHVGGFTPWWFKYTKDGPGCPKCKHGGVETEWETMNIIGSYNAFDDGDACCIGAVANAALFQHFPLAAKLTQNAKPTTASLKERGYVDDSGKVKPLAYAAYYAGDYDSAAWLYNQLKHFWDDPRRGEVPIGWAIDGELSMRSPHVFQYVYDTRTANDWFISGDSGAGYLNPTRLFPGPNGRRGESNVTKAGDAAWKAWCTKWYNRFDVSFTGFLINGDAGHFTQQSLDMYQSFSPDGVVITTGQDPTDASKSQGRAWVTAGGIPVMHHVTDLPASPSDAASTIASIVSGDSRLRKAGTPTFYFLRNILKSATYMAETAKQATAKNAKITWVDPYTMGLLVKASS